MTVTRTPVLDLENDDYNEYADVAKITANNNKIDAAFIALKPAGLAGATQLTRFVGGTTTGSPASGDFQAGDYVVAQTGAMHVCTLAGSPGTWVTLAALSQQTPLAVGTASAGTSVTAARSDHTHPQQDAVTPTGLSGATAISRFAGATSSGSPTTGTFAIGDFVVARDGRMWICTAAGTPGTWACMAPVSASYTPLANGTAAIGALTVAARADHVHPTTGLALSPAVVNPQASIASAYSVPDITVATMHRLVLTANTTLTFPTAAAGKSFDLALVQDATGSRIITWPTAKWPSGATQVLSTAANAIDVFTVKCFDGTNWIIFPQGFAIA